MHRHLLADSQLELASKELASGSWLVEPRCLVVELCHVLEIVVHLLLLKLSVDFLLDLLLLVPGQRVLQVFDASEHV